MYKRVSFLPQKGEINLKRGKAYWAHILKVSVHGWLSLLLLYVTGRDGVRGLEKGRVGRATSLLELPHPKMTIKLPAQSSLLKAWFLKHVKGFAVSQECHELRTTA